MSVPPPPIRQILTELEEAILQLASDHADAFDNFETLKGGALIHLGGGKFWRLEMRTIDVNDPTTLDEEAEPPRGSSPAIPETCDPPRAD